MEKLTAKAIFESWVGGTRTARQALLLLEAEEARIADSMQETIVRVNRADDVGDLVDKSEWSWFLKAQIAESSEVSRYLKSIRDDEAANVRPGLVVEAAQGGARDMNPMVWNSFDADLARVFKALQKGGVLSVSAREFSAHFVRTNGDPMSPDFMESLTAKQDPFSSKQSVLTTQNSIAQLDREGWNAFRSSEKTGKS